MGGGFSGGGVGGDGAHVMGGGGGAGRVGAIGAGVLSLGLGRTLEMLFRLDPAVWRGQPARRTA